MNQPVPISLIPAGRALLRGNASAASHETFAQMLAEMQQMAKTHSRGRRQKCPLSSRLPSQAACRPHLSR